MVGSFGIVSVNIDFLAAALTEALGLKQICLFHTDVSTPDQEVGCVVAGKEGARGGILLTCNLPCGEQLSVEINTSLTIIIRTSVPV